MPSLGTEDKDNTTAEILTTNKLREEIRGWIKEKMESGELSAQPEVDAGSASQSSSANKDIQSMGTSKSKQDHGPSADEHPKQPAVEEDGFFGDDSEDDAEDD